MGSDSIEGRRRVLVVAYYFPPMGLSGVQRVSKFVKYLPAFGWQPSVLTVSPGGYFAFDPSLEEDFAHSSIEIVRTTSADPTRLFGRGRTVSMPSEGVRSLFSTATQFLFVPDNKIGWYLPAVRAGMRMLGARKYDVILSSAPPYTAHLVGATLGRRSGLPIVMDFRDDWVGNPRHAYPTPLHRRLHQRLEARTVSRAAGILTINRHILDRLGGRNPDLLSNDRAIVLPQGYDPSDFPQRHDPGTREHFVLLYTGVFYDAQTPDVLLKAVSRVVAERPALARRIRLEFVGLFPNASFALAERLGLSSMIEFRGYLTHAETVERIRSASALWMVVGRRPGAEGISTGKLFEYFGSRKPILALVPDGEARKALTEYGAGYVVHPDDVDGTVREFNRLFDDWERGTIREPREDFVARFDRRELAGELARLFDNLKEVDELRTR